MIRSLFVRSIAVLLVPALVGAEPGVAQALPSQPATVAHIPFAWTSQALIERLATGFHQSQPAVAVARQERTAALAASPGAAAGLVSLGMALLHAPWAPPLAWGMFATLWPVIKPKRAAYALNGSRGFYGIFSGTLTGLLTWNAFPAAQQGILAMALTGLAAVAVGWLSTQTPDWRPSNDSPLSKLRNTRWLGSLVVALLLFFSALPLARGISNHWSQTPPADNVSVTTGQKTTAIPITGPTSFGVTVSKIEQPLDIRIPKTGQISSVDQTRKDVQAGEWLTAWDPLTNGIADLNRIDQETGGLIIGKDLIADVASRPRAIVHLAHDPGTLEAEILAAIAAFDNLSADKTNQERLNDEASAWAKRSFRFPSEKVLAVQRRAIARQLRDMLHSWRNGQIPVDHDFRVTGDWITITPGIEQAVGAGQKVTLASKITRTDMAQVVMLLHPAEALAVSQLWHDQQGVLVLDRPGNRDTHEQELKVPVPFSTIIDFDADLKNPNDLLGGRQNDPTAGISKTVRVTLTIPWDSKKIPITSEIVRLRFAGAYLNGKRIVHAWNEDLSIIGIMEVEHVPVTTSYPVDVSHWQRQVKSATEEIADLEHLINDINAFYDQYPQAKNRAAVLQSHKDRMAALQKRIEALNGQIRNASATGLVLTQQRGPFRRGDITYYPLDPTSFALFPADPLYQGGLAGTQWDQVDGTVRIIVGMNVFAERMPTNGMELDIVKPDDTSQTVPVNYQSASPRDRQNFNEQTVSATATVEHEVYADFFPDSRSPKKTLVEIQIKETPAAKAAREAKERAAQNAGSRQGGWLTRWWARLWASVVVFAPTALGAQSGSAAAAGGLTGAQLAVGALFVVVLGVGAWVLFLSVRYGMKLVQLKVRGNQLRKKLADRNAQTPVPAAGLSTTATRPAAPANRSTQATPADDVLIGTQFPGLGRGPVDNAVIDHYRQSRETFGRMRAWGAEDVTRELALLRTGLAAMDLPELVALAFLLGVQSSEHRSARSATTWREDLAAYFERSLYASELHIHENLAEGPGRLAVPVTLNDNTFALAERRDGHVYFLSSAYGQALRRPEHAGALVLVWASLLGNPKYAPTSPAHAQSTSALQADEAVARAFETGIDGLWRQTDARSGFGLRSVVLSLRQQDAVRGLNDARLYMAHRSAPPNGIPLTENQNETLQRNLYSSYYRHEVYWQPGQETRYLTYGQRMIWIPLSRLHVPLLHDWLYERGHRLRPHQLALRNLQNEREKIGLLDIWLLWRGYRNKKNKEEFTKKIYHYSVVAVLSVATILALMFWPDFRTTMANAFANLAIAPFISSAAMTGSHSVTDVYLNPAVKWGIIVTFAIGAFKVIGEFLWLVFLWFTEYLGLRLARLDAIEKRFKVASHGMTSEEMFDAITNATIIDPNVGNQDDYRENPTKTMNQPLERFGLEYNAAVVKLFNSEEFMNHSEMAWLLAICVDLYKKDKEAGLSDLPLLRNLPRRHTRADIERQLIAHGYSLDGLTDDDRFALVEAGRIAMTLLELGEYPALVMALVAYAMGDWAQTGHLGPNADALRSAFGHLTRRSVLADTEAFSSHRRYERLNAVLALIDGALSAFERGDVAQVEAYKREIDQLIPPDEKNLLNPAEKSLDRQLVDWMLTGYDATTHGQTPFPLTTPERSVLAFQHLRIFSKSGRRASFDAFFRRLMPDGADFNPLRYLRNHFFNYRNRDEGVGNGAENQLIYNVTFSLVDDLGRLPNAQTILGDAPITIDVTLLENEREGVAMLQRLGRLSSGPIYLISLNGRSDELLKNLDPRIATLLPDVYPRVKLLHWDNLDARAHLVDLERRDSSLPTPIVFSSAEPFKFGALALAQGYRIYTINPFLTYLVLLQFIRLVNTDRYRALPAALRYEIEFAAWIERRIGFRPTEVVNTWNAMRGRVLGAHFDQNFIVRPEAGPFDRSIFTVKDWYDRAGEYENHRGRAAA